MRTFRVEPVADYRESPSFGAEDLRALLPGDAESWTVEEHSSEVEPEETSRFAGWSGTRNREGYDEAIYLVRIVDVDDKPLDDGWSVMVHAAREASSTPLVAALGLTCVSALGLEIGVVVSIMKRLPVWLVVTIGSAVLLVGLVAAGLLSFGLIYLIELPIRRMNLAATERLANDVLEQATRHPRLRPATEHRPPGR